MRNLFRLSAILRNKAVILSTFWLSTLPLTTVVLGLGHTIELSDVRETGELSEVNLTTHCTKSEVRATVQFCTVPHFFSAVQRM